MQRIHVRRHPDNSIDYGFYRRRASALRAEEMDKPFMGPLINLARKVAADRVKAEQRDHAVVLVRQLLKDAKAYPAMFKQIALLEALAGALGVVDGNTD